MRIFLFLIAVFMFTSCQSIDKYIDNNIAEIREILYEGKCEEFDVSFVCGEREEVYVLNGVATPLIEFGVLTFNVKNLDDYVSDEYRYVLIVGTTKYEGDLQKNPFDGTLVADIKKKIEGNENIRGKILIGDFVKEVKLNRIDSSFEISAVDVKKIVAKEFKEEINGLLEEKVFQGEIYIKILNDADMYIGDYYWYVSIISRKGGKLNALISTKTGEILSNNNSLKNN